MISQRVIIALSTYLIVCFILIQYPPKSLPLNNNYSFGIGKHKTILPLWLILVIIALLSYFVSLFF